MTVTEGPDTENDAPFKFTEDESSGEFSRFVSLATRIVAVPKDEVDERRRAARTR